MTFDPFGDFETQGNLRNLTKEKDLEIVRHLEHASFMTGIDAALESLRAAVVCRGSTAQAALATDL